MTEQTLEAARLDVIDALREAATRKDSPLRSPVFATVDDQGWPQARVVILRDFDPSEMVLRVFTDSRSPKVSQLSSTPQAQLVFYDRNRQLHFRVSGETTLHTGDALTKSLWPDLPEFGRGDYLSRQPPGSGIADPSEGWQVDAAFGSENFTVIELKIHRVDWLKLSASGHKRAQLTWRDGRCDGQWVTP